MPAIRKPSVSLKPRVAKNPSIKTAKLGALKQARALAKGKKF